jgi:CO/xanthine dehydrogenase FAD-binding subunit
VFDYFEPTSIEEAISLLGSHGEDAKVLAGGQSLLPMLNFRIVRPECLVDLNRISSLAYIREWDDGLAIGAMTRQRSVERSMLVKTRAPLLAEAIAFVGHPQIRARGTMGGSLAHADPAAELPAAVTALNGTFVTQGLAGRRELTPREFFRSYLATNLAQDEILIEVRLPTSPARTGWAFLEVSRRVGDYALVGIAALVTLARDDVCGDVKMVFTGVGPGPVVGSHAASQLIGQRLTTAVLERVADAVSEELAPDSDIHASAGYRRRVAGTLAKRALVLALDRAQRSVL